MRPICLIVVVALAAPSLALAQATCQAYETDQGWDAATREAFWFTTQGSRLLRATWFLALEQASSTVPLKDALAGFGYIPAPRSTLNPDALPIGFVRDGTGPESHIGLTCAACHSQRIVLAGKPVIIEGGSTLADLEALMRALEQSMAATAGDDPKFARFATAVLGPNPDPGQATALRAAVRDRAASLKTRWNAHWPAGGSGRGRVDAFGQIFNQVAAYGIGVPENARPADAPVSYPFLWNTPQHNKVQWNGSATNGLAGLGPVFRNIGEVLGVFGEVDIVKGGGPPKYQSSVNIDNLKALETMVERLRPPQWPRACAPVDTAQVRAGEKIYKRVCRDCHRVLEREDIRTRFKAKLVKSTEVGTDSRMVDNFYDRFLTESISTGVLNRAPKLFPLLPRFGPFAEGQELLTNVILGTFLGGGRPSASVVVLDEKALDKSLRDAQDDARDDKRKYKARPLTGVWATAPYLHNGSVPTLEDLLQPENNRPTTFYVGNTNYNFAKVGFSIEAAPGAILLDTTMKGNYRTGHSGPNYGTTLGPTEKTALLEYLKVIGERVP